MGMFQPVRRHVNCYGEMVGIAPVQLTAVIEQKIKSFVSSMKKQHPEENVRDIQYTHVPEDIVDDFGGLLESLPEHLFVWHLTQRRVHVVIDQKKSKRD